MANFQMLATESVPQPVSRASRREIAAIVRLLAESLSNDPLQRWLFPEDQSRLKASERLFRRLVSPRIAEGLVSVTHTESGQLASVAVWTAPHPPAPSRWEQLAESLSMRWAHGMRIHEVREGLTALARRHPQQPYWYLMALATAEKQRGNGHAARLLEAKINASESVGQMIALETSLAENISYYERFGFRTVDELQLANGPSVWLMCRD